MDPEAERCKSSGSAGRRGQAVHLLRELDIPLGDPARLMGRKRYLDRVVNVEPLGMMVELFSHHGRASHEAERLAEVLESEFPADGVATLYFAPSTQLGERRLARIAGQFLGHPGTPVAALPARDQRKRPADCLTRIDDYILGESGPLWPALVFIPP